MAGHEALGGLDLGQRLDTSTGRQEFLVSGPSGHPIRISESAYHLLAAVRSGMSWDELALKMAAHPGSPPSPSDIQTAYDRLMRKIDTIEQRTEAGLAKGFWFRWPMLPSQRVVRWVRCLTPLFDRGLAAALLLFISLTIVLALSQGLEPAFDGKIFWPAYGLFVLSLIAHELGHATACKRFGATPEDIGFTIYWIFPAFYSDVTTAWQLRRRHRVVVDLAGVYFQLAVGAVYWLTFLVTGWRAFAGAFVMILGSCLFSLNPVFKFDGYWVLADTLGVTNLSQQPARLARYLMARWHSTPAPTLPWPSWVTAVLAIYSPLAIGFWVVFVGRLAPTVWDRALAYPPLLREVVESLAAWSLPNSEQIENLMVSTFLLSVSALMIRQLSLRLKAGLYTAVSTVRN